MKPVAAGGEKIKIVLEHAIVRREGSPTSRSRSVGKCMT